MQSPEEKVAAPPVEPKTHDYRRKKRGWGHDCTFAPVDDGMRGRMMGWGAGIAEGDFLLLSNPEWDSGETRYRVTKIKYHQDPPDMWSADVEYAPRPEGGP
jgi:hypothetical protein